MRSKGRKRSHIPGPHLPGAMVDGAVGVVEDDGGRVVHGTKAWRLEGLGLHRTAVGFKELLARIAGQVVGVEIDLRDVSIVVVLAMLEYGRAWNGGSDTG